ncbi:MAG: Rieske (2Fe-2S) protein [Pseudomonadales bacterium]|nr:Rieske (2Fe-2S) protein [Pseudomonadales bacterium]
MAITLCHIDDIPEAGARSFALPQALVFAVKKDGEVFVYLNRCPHLGIPLEWQQNEFLDNDHFFIRCSTHGALFVMTTGECIQGPCRGESLWSIDHRLDAGFITLQEDDLPASIAPEPGSPDQH